MLVQQLLGKRNSLTSGFYFQKILKDTAESTALQEIYTLRYQVYCLECGYLRAQDFPAGLESDEYDDSSIHFATYAVKDKTILGTARLVQPEEGQVYPFERHCQLFEAFSPPPREQAAELSRLVVKKDHRRHNGNSQSLLCGLYKEIYSHSRQNGIRYWYVAMEDSLAHSVKKMGFKFTPIGPQTDYYGPVTPHFIDLEELMANLRQKNPFWAAWFNDEPIPIKLWIKMWLTTLIKSCLRKTYH